MEVLSVANAEKALSALAEQPTTFKYPGVVKFERSPWSSENGVTKFNYGSGVHTIARQDVRAWYNTMRKNHLFRGYLEKLMNESLGLTFEDKDVVVNYPRLKAWYENELRQNPLDTLLKNLTTLWLGDMESRYDDWVTFHWFFSGLGQSYEERQTAWKSFHPVHTLYDNFRPGQMKDVVAILLSPFFDSDGKRFEDAYTIDSSDPNFYRLIRTLWGRMMLIGVLGNWQTWQRQLGLGVRQIGLLLKDVLSLPEEYTIPYMLYITVDNSLFCYSCSALDVVSFAVAQQVDPKDDSLSQTMLEKAASLWEWGDPSMLTLDEPVFQDAKTVLYPVTECGNNPLSYDLKNAIIYVSLSFKSIDWILADDDEDNELKWMRTRLKQWFNELDTKTFLTLQIRDGMRPVCEIYEVPQPSNYLNGPRAEFVVGDTLSGYKFLAEPHMRSMTQVTFLDKAVSPSVAFDIRGDRLVVETPERYMLGDVGNMVSYDKTKRGKVYSVEIQEFFKIPWGRLQRFQGGLTELESWVPRNFTCEHFNTDGLVPVVAFPMRSQQVRTGQGVDMFDTCDTPGESTRFRLVLASDKTKPTVLFTKRNKLYLITREKVELLSPKVFAPSDDKKYAEYLVQAVQRLTAIYGKPDRRRDDANNFHCVDYYEEQIDGERIVHESTYVREEDVLEQLFPNYLDQFFNHYVDNNRYLHRCVGHWEPTATEGSHAPHPHPPRVSQLLDSVRSDEARRNSDTVARFLARRNIDNGSCSYCHI